MTEANLNLIRGTVDLLILKALSGGERHGYAVSEWLRNATEGTLLVEEGTLYPALHRLEAKGWVEAEWGLSDNNRRAKYYRLTPAGRTQLETERRTWDLYASAVEKALAEDGTG